MHVDVAPHGAFDPRFVGDEVLVEDLPRSGLIRNFRTNWPRLAANDQSLDSHVLPFCLIKL
jgi:hypothetical protein